MIRALAILLLTTATVSAEVQLKPVVYEHEGVEFTGYVAYDDAIEGKRPGVMVVHEWWGNNNYARRRAIMLAELGYVAFAADMYGTDKVTTEREQAMKWSGELKDNVPLYRARALAGFEQLKKQPHVDTDKLAAIGYCFGGTTVLQLAYAGADVDAIVSFHGGLVPPTDEEAKAIKPRVLICHGADDPFVKPEAITATCDQLTKGGVDWQMIYYAHSVHTFTNPDAAGSDIPGVGYNEKADKRSWEDMKQLFDEAL